MLGENVTTGLEGFVHTFSEAFSVVIPHVPVVMYSGKYSVAPDLSCAFVLFVARRPSVACAYSRHSLAEWPFRWLLFPRCFQEAQECRCLNVFVLKFVSFS